MPYFSIVMRSNPMPNAIPVTSSVIVAAVGYYPGMHHARAGNLKPTGARADRTTLSLAEHAADVDLRPMVP
jgi:hypothetical protein